MPQAANLHLAALPTSGVGVHVRGVSRTFPGGVRAIDRIDVQIQPGEFVALLGPTGCGKSTLLRIIAGLDQPTAGTVSTSDLEPSDAISRPNRTSLAKPEVACVFQDATLLPWRNVLNNVSLPLELLGVPKPGRLARAAAALENVGLSDAVSRYPAQLSGGMRMRASLARALVTDPALLLLDEPFAALDEITRQHLDEQLRALWISRRMTTLFVTHSTAEAAYLADRAIVFSQRPATIVLDHALDLPIERRASLRADPHFAGQTRILFEALDRGGA